MSRLYRAIPAGYAETGEPRRFCKRVRVLNGFTMIELLVVTVIIIVLAGILVQTSRYAMRRGQESRARSELQLIASALEEYRVHYGGYPAVTNLHTAAEEALNIRLSPNWMDYVWLRPQLEGRMPFLRVPWLEGMDQETFESRTEGLHQLSLSMRAQTSPSGRLSEARRYLEGKAPYSNYDRLDIEEQRLAYGVEPPIQMDPFNLYLDAAGDPYSSPPFLDPWGRDYMVYRAGSDPYTRYNNPGSRFAYDLWSYGPGERPGGAWSRDTPVITIDDDSGWIRNW